MILILSTLKTLQICFTDEVGGMTELAKIMIRDCKYDVCCIYFPLTPFTHFGEEKIFFDEKHCISIEVKTASFLAKK